MYLWLGSVVPSVCWIMGPILKRRLIAAKHTRIKNLSLSTSRQCVPEKFWTSGFSYILYLYCFDDFFVINVLNEFAYDVSTACLTDVDGFWQTVDLKTSQLMFS